MALTKVSTHVIADDLALPGNPTSTTQSAGNNTTRLATTAFVTGAVSDLVDGAPSTLNTLNEIAAALNDDAALNTTLTNSIATKLPLAGGTLTGALTVGTSASKVLEVSRTGSATYDLTVSDIGDGAAQLFINAQTNDTGFSLRPKDSGGTNTNAIFIAPNGKVGIQETSPDSALHVNSGTPNVVAKFESTDSIAAIQFTDPNGTAEIGCIGNEIGLFPSGTERLRLQNDGALILKPNGITTGLRLQGRSSDNNFFIQFNNNDGSTNYGSIGNNSGQSAVYYSFDNHIFTNTSSANEYVRIDSNGYIRIKESGKTHHSSYVGFTTPNSVYITDDSGGASKATSLTHNAYANSSNAWAYMHADEATMIQSYNGSLAFYNASAGSADAVITFTKNLDIDVNGQLLGKAGGVTLPTFSFIGDTNTGMTRPTSDTIQFVTGGTERLRLGNGQMLVNDASEHLSAGKTVVYGGSGNAENGGQTYYSGTMREYRNVVSAYTAAGSYRYWHIKTNIKSANNVMFVGRVHGYAYGNSGHIVDIQRSGYAYAAGTLTGSQSVNNGSSSDTLDIYFASDNYMCFRHSTPSSGYYSGLSFDIKMQSPTGYSWNFEILGNAINATSGNHY